MSATTNASRFSRSSARLGVLAVAAGAVTWGFWGLAIQRSGLSGPHVPCIVLGAMALFGLPLLPRRLPQGRAAWLALAAIGLCDALNALLYFEALSRGPTPVAALSHYLAPVLVAALTPLVLHSPTPKGTWLALPLSLVGLGLLLGPEALAVGGALDTAMLGAGSAVFYAFQILLQKRFSGRLTPAELLVWHAVFGALILLPFAVGASQPALGGVLWLVGGAIVGGCLAGTIFLWGLARVSAPTAGVVTYVEPLVGVAVGVALLGESLCPTAPLGALLIVGAGLMVVRGAARA